jgi:hypothetical protein
MFVFPDPLWTSFLGIEFRQISFGRLSLLDNTTSAYIRTNSMDFPLIQFHLVVVWKDMN